MLLFHGFWEVLIGICRNSMDFCRFVLVSWEVVRKVFWFGTYQDKRFYRFVLDRFSIRRIMKHTTTGVLDVRPICKLRLFKETRAKTAT